MQDIVLGRNPVIELFKSKERTIEKIMILNGDNKGSVKKVIAMAKEKNIQIEYVDREALDRLSEGNNHQGVIAIVSPYVYKTIDDMFELAAEREEDPFLVILDGIEDVHNLGAIIRTAECAGVHGIIIPKRRSASVNSTVLKTSAGATEYMNIAKVTNLSKTIEDLKERGLWIYGADMEGSYHYGTELKGPIGLVIGSEGKGMSSLVKKKCDGLVKIPMRGKINSLNASAAFSIISYEIVRQRRW